MERSVTKPRDHSQQTRWLPATFRSSAVGCVSLNVKDNLRTWRSPLFAGGEHTNLSVTEAGKCGDAFYSAPFGNIWQLIVLSSTSIFDEVVSRGGMLLHAFRGFAKPKPMLRRHLAKQIQKTAKCISFTSESATLSGCPILFADFQERPTCTGSGSRKSG